MDSNLTNLRTGDRKRSLFSFATNQRRRKPAVRAIRRSNVKIVAPMIYTLQRRSLTGDSHSKRYIETRLRAVCYYACHLGGPRVKTAAAISQPFISAMKGASLFIGSTDAHTGGVRNRWRVLNASARRTSARTNVS